MGGREAVFCRRFGDPGRSADEGRSSTPFGEIFERVSIENADVVQIPQNDQSDRRQLADRSAHGLDSEAEMVGNIEPRHRQPDHIAGVGALRQGKQERCNALVGIHAPQLEHLKMRVGEAAGHHRKERST